MDSLKQYTDLFLENRDLIDRGSCPLVNSFRNKAFAELEKKALPKKGSENYETIDLEAILAPDFGINLARVDIDVNALAPFRCGVPNMTSSLFLFRNDIYSETPNSRRELPEGLYVDSLKNFCRNFPEEAERFYGKNADLSNPLVALNSMFVQDGIVIWARKGVKMEQPIQIVGILENGMPLMAVRRILIIAEEDAIVKLLDCDHTQNDNVNFINLQVAEVFAADNAVIEICAMEESSRLTSRLASTYVSQGTASSVSSVAVTLYNGITRNEYYCKFTGPDASLMLSGMAIEDCDRQINTFSIVEHSHPGCHTDELFKYVVDDEAVGSFSGMVKVIKGASKTEAFQSNRNIIGNDGARVFSKPRLEIYDDDVKCSHGSATGQLDERQIFYMRTRGLSEEQARFLLKQAFMADVIDRVQLPDFRSRLHSLVERRFAGQNRNCSSCRNNGLC